MKIAATKSLDGKLSMTGNHSFDQERSRKDLAKAIILQEYPLSIVEHHGFRNFLHGLQPLFKVVCRNTIKSDIFKIYMEEKTKLYALFEKIPGRTTDMWSSKPKRGCMAITAHFIDRIWILRNLIIGFEELELIELFPRFWTNSLLSSKLTVIPSSELRSRSLNMIRKAGTKTYNFHVLSFLKLRTYQSRKCPTSC